MRPLPLSRKQHRSAPGEETDPLGKLRRRCMLGWRISGSAYLATVASVVAFPSTFSLGQVVSLEIGLGLVVLFFAIVAVFAYFLTQSTEYALSLWSMADGAKKAGARRGLEPVTPIPPARNPTTGELSPIPIEYGRHVRQQRTHRAG